MCLRACVGVSHANCMRVCVCVSRAHLSFSPPPPLLPLQTPSSLPTSVSNRQSAPKARQRQFQGRTRQAFFTVCVQFVSLSTPPCYLSRSVSDINIDTHMRKHVCTHARTHVHAIARTHACTHAHLHACMRAHTHARTHITCQSQALSLSLSCLCFQVVSVCLPFCLSVCRFPVDMTKSPTTHTHTRRHSPPPSTHTRPTPNKRIL